MTQTETSTRPTSQGSPALRILRVADIMFHDRGWTRGHATLAFDDVPPDSPGYLAFGPLKIAVIEEIDAGAGYPRHAHRNVETILAPLSGAIAHEDSVLGAGITGPSDVAVISAGTGIEHSEIVDGERNARAVMFWLVSDPRDAEPRFAKRTFDRSKRRNTLVALASGRGGSSESSEGALHIRSDSTVYSAVLDEGAEIAHRIERGRRGYLLAPDGALEMNGLRAETGDRVLAESPGSLRIRALAPTEVFLVDLPG